MSHKNETATPSTAEVIAQASHLIANREKLERLLTQLNSLAGHDWGGNFLEISNLPEFTYKETVTAGLGEVCDFFTEYNAGGFQ